MLRSLGGACVVANVCAGVLATANDGAALHVGVAVALLLLSSMSGLARPGALFRSPGAVAAAWALAMWTAVPARGPPAEQTAMLGRCALACSGAWCAVFALAFFGIG